MVAGVGGFFLGMISSGLGELNGFVLLRRCHMPGRVAVATSVFVVAPSALAAAGTHLVQVRRVGGDALGTVLSVVMFTVPGVVLGAQVGAAVGSRIPQKVLERGLGILFVVVATLMLSQALL